MSNDLLQHAVPRVAICVRFVVLFHGLRFVHGFHGLALHVGALALDANVRNLRGGLDVVGVVALDENHQLLKVRC